MIRDKIVLDVQKSVLNGKYRYLDKDTFVFEFDGGVDKDGDKYFYHIERLIDKNKWVFQRWYKDDITNADFNQQEEQYIIAVVKNLM